MHWQRGSHYWRPSVSRLFLLLLLFIFFLIKNESYVLYGRRWSGSVPALPPSPPFSIAFSDIRWTFPALNGHFPRSEISSLLLLPPFYALIFSPYLSLRELSLSHSPKVFFSLLPPSSFSHLLLFSSLFPKDEVPLNPLHAVFQPPSEIKVSVSRMETRFEWKLRYLVISVALFIVRFEYIESCIL